MSQSRRVISGSITRGSTATNIGLDTVSGSMDAYRQGVYLRGLDDLSAFSSFKIRANSSFVTTVNKKKVVKDYFDDSLAPINLGAPGSGNHTRVSLVSAGRMGSKLSHEI